MASSDESLSSEEEPVESGEEAELDYEFVEKLTEDQLCPICMKVLCQPHMINCCEQQNCQECLKKWLEKNKTCPHCRSTDYSHMLMKQKSRKLGELKVYCPNKKHGCQSILKISECGNHLSKTNDDGCLYVQLRCPNRCKVKVFRGDMKKHIIEQCSRREVSCAHCAEKDEHRYITGHHQNICPLYPLNCTQECGAVVMRKDLKTQRHLSPGGCTLSLQ